MAAPRGQSPREECEAGRETKMWSRRNKTARCSGCDVLLVVPPQARTIRCAVCRSITDVGSSQDPVRQAMGFLKSVVMNISNGISSLNSSSSSSGSSSHGYPITSPPPSFPRVRGKKRAVLVGVSYVGQRYELKGTVNDVNCMRYLLIERFGFPAEGILVLTGKEVVPGSPQALFNHDRQHSCVVQPYAEEERGPYRVPTKENLRMAMRWLVSGCESGDSLVFHFSGHGVQRLDPSGDEVDGLDEALCPLDFEANGSIVDDEINETLVRPLPRGVKLHALVDSCHSGTVLDLRYLCRLSRWSTLYLKPSHSHQSGWFEVHVHYIMKPFCFAQGRALAGSTSTGAMTYSFIQAIENEPGTTYGRLLTAMRSAIREASTGIRMSGPIVSLMRKVFNFGLTQVCFLENLVFPLLSFSARSPLSQFR
ncbi:hypothetical protein BHM03_00019014 [Ensete ventricosum]|uniref:Uncharacterized protein n=1 Tax=Ensete ventricosum TaxID=4639 RepID=A0A445MFH1_ENSVE|nr:hypothetical protein BHM03_00019014 [Ensete ventricosum]